MPVITTSAYAIPSAPAMPAGLVAWFDASDATTLFTDQAGTNPIDTGLSETVLRWNDKSGNGYDTIGNLGGGVYNHTGFNGNPTITISGVGFQHTTNNPIAGGAARTVFVVAQSTTGLGRTTFSFRRSNPTHTLQVSDSVGDYFVYTDSVNSPRNANVPVANPSSGFNVYTYSSAGTDTFIDFYVNGVQQTVNQTQGVSTEGGTAGFYIGSRGSTSDEWEGIMSEVQVYSGVLSTVDRQSVETSLITKWS